MSPADRELILENGLAVVECSWARLDDVPFAKIASPHERLRQYLIFLKWILPLTGRFPFSTLPHRDESHELWQAVAAELRRSSRCGILHHRF